MGSKGSSDRAVTRWKGKFILPLVERNHDGSFAFKFRTDPDLGKVHVIHNDDGGLPLSDGIMDPEPVSIVACWSKMASHLIQMEVIASRRASASVSHPKYEIMFGLRSCVIKRKAPLARDESADYEENDETTDDVVTKNRPLPWGREKRNIREWSGGRKALRPKSLRKRPVHERCMPSSMTLSMPGWL